MTFDTLLTISMTLDEKAELHAVSKALGMSGMGAVVRAIVDGRLPPLQAIPDMFNQYQLDKYNSSLNKYKGVQND